MTDKELRRLRRDDLLQILIRQQRQIDELTEKLKQAEAELEKREIAMKDAGSVAEAALRLNGVFEAAQAAADQYGAEMRSRADELEQAARKQSEDAKRLADELVRNARSEAERILQGAKRDAGTFQQYGSTPTAVEPTEVAPQTEAPQRRGLFGRSKKA